MKNFKIIVDDIVTYKELWELFKNMNKTKGIIPAKDIYHYNWRTPKQDKTMLKNSIFFTARNNKNKILGLVRIITDSAYAYYISDVMVIPDMQRKGIGKALMNKILKYCKEDGFMKIFLSVIPGNEKFYKKFGFKKTMCEHLEIKFKEVKKRI